MTARVFSVEWMACAHCVRALELQLDEEPTMSLVDIDLNLKSLTVSGEELDAGRVLAAIARAGSDVSHRFAAAAASAEVLRRR